MVIQDSEAAEYVLRIARENDVRFIRLWFTDILGALKGFAITIDDLEIALSRGVGFDGSSIEGFARSDESDRVALPDPSTFRILPWRPRENAVARMFCDILTPDGEPFDGDPRYILKRNLERTARMGYTFYVGPELEYFYFKDSTSLVPLDNGGYFDQSDLGLSTDLRRETVLTLEEMGIPVEYSHHEVSPSQHEIVLRYSDALTMADNVMTYRLAVKEVATSHGVYATFMPKPMTQLNGSGMHTHMSLFRGNNNVFSNPDHPNELSDLAMSFVAGLMQHAPEITLVTNQWVNSYKRLVPGYEAPLFISWARTNQSDLIRVPEYQRWGDNSARVEYRAPDPACNPYLAFSVMLAAGLEGVEKGYNPPPLVEENVFDMTPREREAKGIGTLPGSLWEAIKIAEQSELLCRTLGDRVFGTLIENKKIEWERLHSQVSDQEIKQYLPTL